MFYFFKGSRIKDSKYLIVILVSIFLILLTLANSLDILSLRNLFLEIRSNQDKKSMEALIKTLESLNTEIIDFNLLLAECYLEYGIWGG